MPWFNQPPPEPTHVYTIPAGTIIKGKGGIDLLLEYDAEIKIIGEMCVNAYDNLDNKIYAECDVRGCFSALCIHSDNEE